MLQHTAAYSTLFCFFVCLFFMKYLVKASCFKSEFSIFVFCKNIKHHTNFPGSTYSKSDFVQYWFLSAAYSPHFKSIYLIISSVFVGGGYIFFPVMVTQRSQTTLCVLNTLTRDRWLKKGKTGKAHSAFLVCRKVFASLLDFLCSGWDFNFASLAHLFRFPAVS